jgi:hypothetical protein
LKKFLLYSVFLFPVICEAQANVYHPFPEDSAKWCVGWSNCSNGILDRATYQLTDNVFINGNWYNRMLHYEEHCHTHMTMCLCDSVYSTDTATYYIRQDTTLKKVWLYYPPTNSDTIFLDFDLHVGDTIDARKEYWAGQSLEFWIVSSVDSTFMNGQYRTQYKYYSNGAPGCIDSMIEGIGPMHGFFNLPTNCFEAGGWTDIFSENNRIVYSSYQGDTAWWESWHCHDFTLETNQIVRNSFSISPNPSHSQITISLNEIKIQSGKFKVFDITGQLVMEEKIHSQFSTFNFQLSSGVYFVEVGDGEKIAVQKLVIQ